MGTALLALCFCALSLVLALFVGISPISDKAKVRFMYVGAALSLIAVPIMSHYIAGLNNIVDELRYQAVLVFIVAVCCYCFVMANMVKYNVMKKKVAVLEGTLEKLEQERAAAIYAGRPQGAATFELGSFDRRGPDNPVRRKKEPEQERFGTGTGNIPGQSVQHPYTQLHCAGRSPDTRAGYFSLCPKICRGRGLREGM